MFRTLGLAALSGLTPLPAAIADRPASAPAVAQNDARTRHAVAPFASVDLVVDLGGLPESERRALGKLVEAARIMDALFLRQVWSGNDSLLVELAGAAAREGDPGHPAATDALHAFLLHKGPWSRLDDNKPFLDGIPVKPAQGNFYPLGATKDEVDAWMKSLAPAEAEKARGFFTVVRRDPAGAFTLVPYSVEYQGDLERAAALLREAAALTVEPTLKRYLTTRAAAFLSNDYYASDVAWMELDAAVEPTIGPYEVYEDEWFNAKAAFEAFITVRDDVETKKLAGLSSRLQDIEDHLPIAAKLRNPKLGALAPIRVVNELFVAGDANRGVQTAAFNLPNDERVTKEKGTKRVMLKNVQRAKFDQVLMPIARQALPAADLANIHFDAFFTHILMHELMHGLGPHGITVGGRATTVRAEMQEAYSALEEAKADVSGLWAMQYLIDKKVPELPNGAALAKTMHATYLASCFRSIRFGINEAHGKGVALQVNWLLDAGGYKVTPDGRFTVDEKKAKKAIEALTTELMTIQAAGDKAKAKDLLARLGVVRPEVQRVLDRLKDVPVDIEPRFVTAATLPR